MKRAIFTLIAGSMLFGLGCGLSAAVTFQDNLDNNNLGKSSSVTYGLGCNNQAALFTGLYDYIRYDTGLIPLSGTLAFDVKQTTYKLGTLFTTVGMASAYNGDMTIMLGSQGEVEFLMYDGHAWKSLITSQKLDVNNWHHIAASFGSQGMKLFVDGQTLALASYTNNRYNRDLYAGDYQPDNYYSSKYLTTFSGYLDNIKCSNVQSDSALLTVPATVPEPSALIALGTGLLSAFAAFRRRRF